MSDITRYTFDPDAYAECECSMEACKQGEYMLASDHESTIATLTAELENVRAGVQFDEDYIKVKAVEFKAIQAELEQVKAERDRMREALDRIARPVWWMQEDQKRKTGSINGINGQQAVALSNNADYLKNVATEALTQEGK